MKNFTSPLRYLILGAFFLFIYQVSYAQSFSHPITGTKITGDVLHADAGSDFIGILYTLSGNIYYNRLNADGTWDDETILGPGTEGRITIDNADNIHIAFISSGKISYMKFNGSVWSEPVYIESLNIGGTGSCSKPDIATDASGGVHLTYTDSHGTSDDYRYPDIMYAKMENEVFNIRVIFRGYRDYSSSGSWGASYYNKGSFIAVNNTGDYFIMSHCQDIWRWYAGTDNNYYIKISSNLGTGSIGNYGSDIFTIHDIDFDGNNITALYKQTNFKVSELTLNGADINFVNTSSVTAVSSISSLVSGNSRIVVGGKNNTDLFTQSGTLGHIYEDLKVKNTAVAVIGVNEVFYAVYTDNTDNKIKIREVAEPLSFTRFDVTGQDGLTFIDGQNASIEITAGSTMDLSALIPAYTTTSDVTGVTVESVAQVSGTTLNDFRNPITYTLSDGITSREWLVKIQPLIMDTLEITICAGESLNYNGVDHTDPGEYLYTFQSVEGNDSLVLLLLTVAPVYNHIEEAAICQGDTYLFGPRSLTVAGEYTEVFESVSGCDSTVTLNLTVNSGYNSQFPADENVEAYYPFQGNANDESGNQHHGTVNGATLIDDRFGNPNGAYSFDGINDYIDAGDWENGGAMSFNFWAKWEAWHNWSRLMDFGLGQQNNNIYIGNEATKDNLMFHTLDGSVKYLFYCESSLPLNTWIMITCTVDENGVMKAYQDGVLAGTFNGFTPAKMVRNAQYFGRSNWSADGYFKGAIDEVTIYNIALTGEEVQNIYISTKTYIPPVDIEICSTELPYIFNETELTESGTYTETFQTIHGCDSVVTLNLIVNPVYNHTVEQTICEGETYIFETQNLTASGQYTEVFESAYGCDSTVVLTLTVNPEYNHSDETSICQGETYVFGTQNLTTAGKYTEIFESISGCDSTVVLTLTVYPVYNHTAEAAICQGETFSFGSQSLTSSGEYTEIFKTVRGCDSTVVLNLTVYPEYNHTKEANICEGDTYEFGNQVITTAGEYTEVFESVAGCDSTVVLILHVNPNYNHTHEVTICEGGTYIFGSQNLTSAGEYTEMFESVTGCDSLVVLTVAVNPAYTSTDEAVICQGETFVFGSQSLTTAGVYTEIFESVTGCDSTVVLTLTVNQVYNHTAEANICQGESYVFGSQILSSSGEYTEVFTSATGCDSTVVLSLTVNPVYDLTTTMSLYSHEMPVIFGTQTLTGEGTFTESFISVNGCDSIVTLTLSIRPADATPPVIVCQPIHITLNRFGAYMLGDNDIQLLTSGTTDDNTAAENLIIQVEPRYFTCSMAGTAVAVTVSATDQSGNTATANTSVWVADKTPPEIVCNNVSLSLDNDGQAHIDVSDLFSSAEDVCGILKVTADKTSFNSNDLGTVNISVTATDIHNNINTCTASAVITDQLPPKFTPVANITVNINEGACETEVNYPDIHASDNCGVKNVYLIQGLGPDVLHPTGISIEKWVAMDNSGNSDTLEFEIIVVKTPAMPSADRLNDIELNEDSGEFKLHLTNIFDGSDCEDHPLEFSLSFSNQDLLQSHQFNFMPGRDSAELSMIPANDAWGETVAFLNVKNSVTGKQFRDTFNIRIIPVNNAPFMVRQPGSMELEAGKHYKLHFDSKNGVLFDDVDDEHLELSIKAAEMETFPDWLSFSTDSLWAFPSDSDIGCIQLILTATDNRGATADAPFTLCVTVPVGLNQLSAGDIKVYPNPSDGKLHIDFPHQINSIKDVVILNSIGKIIFHEKITDQKRMEADLSGNASGLYILRATGSGFSFTYKIILKTK